MQYIGGGYDSQIRKLKRRGPAELIQTTLRYQIIAQPRVFPFVTKVALLESVIDMVLFVFFD